ncbi:MAG: ATP-dependent RecD-like DNA helicase [Candidatus Hydrogenedentes bacterium]|nr:ATP-dependent RecD-like DNA helicase [Candidatus Hydrogenedentota bacterium]
MTPPWTRDDLFPNGRKPGGGGPPDAPGQTDLETTDTVEGVVERIVYENPENGFFVGRLRRDDTRELETFVGNLMAVSPGETVRLTGRWEVDRKFGRELRVTAYETVLPSTAEGIERFLGSGMIAGVGKEMAKRLVAAFGRETLRVIAEQPERLRGVPGIGAKRAAQVHKSLGEKKALQSIMVFLQGHGISPALAVRIHKHYGDGAAAVMRENPYRLAADISGVGFQGADTIARRLGIAADAPERLRAGVLHTLSAASGDGHVFLPRGELLSRAAELLAAPPGPVDAAVTALAASGGVVLEDDAVFSPLLHAAERRAAEGLKRLLRTPHDPVEINVENALRWVEREGKITLSERQREAVRQGARGKVLVITGGPGTGKTTVLKSLLAILERKGVSFVLAAPTGRAAKRMEAATGRDARTLHRLLEFNPATGRFAKGEHAPLATDLLVVDEVSMVDIQLLSSVLEALPSFARLLLVGDVDQLPSVGAGSVLLDIIASGLVPVVRLDTVFRQAEESGIIANAHRINRGEMPVFNDRDFVLIERDDPAKAVETLVEVAARRLPARFGLDPLRDIQVLAPLRRGDAGVEAVNAAMQTALNPNGAPLPGRAYGLGDKVMQLRNNYTLDVYNGDTGVVTAVDLEAGEFQVSFDDGRAVLYPVDEADNLAPAYCATVHKAQGSEYPAVVLSLHNQHFMLLQRNVLYTAVTRGRRLVVIVGSRRAVARAVRNTSQTRRNTRLAARLRNEVR